jgi:hypothetical protein
MRFWDWIAFLWLLAVWATITYAIVKRGNP